MTAVAAPRTSYFANLKTGTKIFGGFVITLALLLALAAVSWNSNRQAQINLAQFSAQSDIQMNVTEAETALLSAGLAANRFVAQTSENDIQAFSQNNQRAVEELEIARSMMVTEGNRQAIEEVLSLQSDYAAQFDHAVELITRHEDLVERIINEHGAAVRQTITDFRDVEADTGSFDTHVPAAELNGQFLLIRTVAARFLAGHQSEDRNEVSAELVGLQDEIAALKDLPVSEEQLDRLDRISDGLVVYREGFEEVAEAVEQTNTLVEQMDETSNAIFALSSETLSGINAVQQEVATEAHTAGLAAERTLLAVSAIALIAGIGIAWLITRAITGPMGSMTTAMKRLAEGDATAEVPAIGRRDEIGSMAGAVQVFKENLIRNREMEREVADQKRQAEEEQKRAMNEMADSFEESVGELVQMIASAVQELEAAAQTMTSSAEETSSQATTVSAAALQASANVQTVASATEEMAASIREISQQVASSARSADNAVTGAQEASVTVNSLAEAAERIGQVVQLIQDIAAQTNLLALNATIEAARAGEAGKGFAVVASEVKNLANQTAKATENISGQIQGMQGVTQDTVKVIERINHMITESREISNSIAAAVEEQDSATGEITRNIQEAANGTGEVSSAIDEVSQAAGEGGAAANQVLASARELGETAGRLQKGVAEFVGRVRAG